MKTECTAGQLEFHGLGVLVQRMFVPADRGIAL